MTVRILPPEEWPKLAGTEAETAVPTFDPRWTHVIVVERDGQILGCHVLMPVWHAECLWIHPDHRGKASVGRRLWLAVQRFASALGIRSVMTGAGDDRVRGLLDHVGAVRVPVDQYLIPVKG